jgi:chemotaxis protein MotB
MRIPVALIVLTFLCSSCIVSKKKYDDMLAQKVRTEADLADRTTELEKVTADLTDATAKLNQLKEDTTNLGTDKRNAQKRLAELEKEHDQLSESA